MAGFFDTLITYVKVDTTSLPPFVIPQPLAPLKPGETGTTNAVLRTLKPRIEIGIEGSDPIVLQKWGDPRPGKWPEVATYLGLGGGLLFALAGYGLYSALKGRGRGRAVSGLSSLRVRRRGRRAS
jgi:hypothetical protein